MTVAIPCHRALTQKITTRSFSVVARLPIVSTVSRVRATTDRRSGHKLRLPLYASRNSQIATRTYATSSSTKPAGRPKAHTGREAAARRPKSPTKKDASAKPGPKTSEGKSKVGRKPKVKSTASKQKSQAAKTKEKKKPLSKTALNRHRLQGIKDLRAKALLTEPKKLPATVWAIIFNEGKKPGQNVEDSKKSTQQAAERLKNLTAEEKEHYNHLAHENQAQNDAAYKQWLATHTPDDIREANIARKTLQKQHTAAATGRKERSHKFAPIKDDRLVRRPTTTYGIFVKKRWESGDFEKMSIAESAKLMSREWKALSEAEKKPYLDEHEKNMNQYVEEYRTVYGSPPPSTVTKTKSSSS